MLEQRFVRAALTCIVLAMTARVASGQSRICRVVDYPGSMATLAHGINARGDVVGEYIDSSGGQHGFLLSGGLYSPINGPGPTWTIAYGINDGGQIVGAYGAQPVCNCVDDIEAYGFVSTAGAMSTFDIGRSQTIPLDINNAGQIVGYYHDRDGDIQDHPRGFLLDQGSLTRIDAPGGGPLSEVGTQPAGINDAGLVVGNAYGPSFFMFTWLNGQMTRLPNPPGAERADAGGIDKGGTVVGYYSTGSTSSSFVRSKNRFSDFNCPEVETTYLKSLNDKGALVGSYYVGNRSYGFYTPPITFIDPIPDLLNGQILTTDDETLATKGRQVYGVGADGVTVIVLRIPTANIGDQVTLTLLRSDNHQDPALSSDEDGGLGTPNDPCCEFTQTVTSVFTSNGPMAFATYRSPSDFPRPDGGDAGKRSREVFIRVQSSGGGDTTIPVKLVRPLVALVHGIWASEDSWNNFNPLVVAIDGSDDRFRIQRISYNKPVSIVASNPSYGLQLFTPRENSLGFGYNAPFVLQRLEQVLKDFKGGFNAESISVAGVQLDIVTHSMGGDIARTMVRTPNYLERNSFRQGIIHKLITIDTPHLGTPVATRMLLATPQEDNRCLRMVLGAAGSYSYDTATVAGRGTVSGAVADLRVGSPAMQAIALPGPIGIHAAMIAGIYSNFSSLGGLTVASACKGSSALARQLKNSTVDGWQAVFTDDSSQESDGLVSVRSQRNNLTAQIPFLNVVHSSALSPLGFAAPSVLDSVSTVPGLVISLLNEPYYTNRGFYHVINP